ncbi:DUF2252 family protein [uncultured Salinisphaera sp.]|uniref:DUF2252 family protein n=1 Tax=uncultured Salinisphaera sp. TaxID=359372 RepID=UPI0032B2B482|tara:strand:+ start:76 stop:1398 length:1323 start_codon:yes stop_codon:yes gene_type:complete
MSFHFRRASRRQLVIAAIDQANAALSDIDRARKYAKMSRSPYRFFRGTNHLFWADVWNDWRSYLYGGLLDSQTWLQGDAHVYNHGAYGDDHQGMHYGMDDFDDAVIADYQYDLWRHTASMVLDAEENAGLSPAKSKRAIRHFLTSYLDTLARTADGATPDDIHVAYEDKPLSHFMKKVAKKRGVPRQLDKWLITGDDGTLIFDLDYHKLGGVSAAERSQLVKALAQEYPATLRESGEAGRANFSVLDVARRLNAGTGSLGLDRFYALIESHDDPVDTHILLDIKQQTRPPAYDCMTASEKRRWREAFKHEAHRHYDAFYALSQHPDGYLGWLSLGEQWFSVRRRSPYKKDFPTHKISGFKDYRALTTQWGRILAREHMRGAASLRPDDPGYFHRAVTARIGADREGFKNVVCDFAFTYAECARRDYWAFIEERGVPETDS